MKKIAVTDYNFKNLEQEKSIIEKAGYVFEPYNCKTKEELIEACGDAVGLLNQRFYLSEEILRELPNCKAIVRYGVGVDNIDLEGATKNNIKVGNVPNYCINEVADHTISLLLAALRKLPVYNKSVRDGDWSYKVGMPIYQIQNLNLGVLGFGKIAQNMVHKIGRMGFKNIFVYDPYVTDELVEKYDGKKVDFDTLIESCDCLSINVPLTKSTHHIMNREVFKRMKSNAVIVNTGRGQVIDEQALIEALHQGLISGAGLDVLEKEPIDQDNELLKMDNVILTPHVGRYSEEAELRLQQMAAENLLEMLAGTLKGLNE